MSGNDQDTQASLISKVIDQKGPGFAEKVTIKSKELKEKKKYSAKETAAIITGAGMPDNVMTKLSHLMHNLGHLMAKFDHLIVNWQSYAQLGQSYGQLGPSYV